jgi:hypothetical protein
MRFLLELTASFLVFVIVGLAFALLYMALQWFLQATDVTAACNWSREGTSCHLNLDIRNHSKSRTYLLGNIAYTNGTDRLVWFDNKSLMGKELLPGSINDFQNVAPVRNSSTISECLGFQVTLRLKSGRKLWLDGQGPRQPVTDRIHRGAFRLRNFIEKRATSMELQR